MALLPNLTASWKLDDLTDATGRGNTLTNNNSATFNTGKIGNAVYLTAASSQYLSLASNSDVQAGNVDFTLAAWFYTGNAGAAQAIMAKRGDTTGQEEYVVYFDGSSTVKLQFYVFKPTDSFVSVTANNFGTLSANTWYCVIAWYDSVGQTINISVNNGTADSVSTGGSLQAASNGNFTIGRQDKSAGFAYVDGRVDNVNIWKRVLSASDRTAFYNSGSGIEYPFGESLAAATYPLTSLKAAQRRQSGPMVSRVGIPTYPNDQAPVTDTNFRFPNYPPVPQSTGPVVLRQQHVHTYQQPSDFAPLTDQNFEFPNYQANFVRFVGPQVLRNPQFQRWVPPPDLAPITDQNFIPPNYSQLNRFVGPPALWSPQIHYYPPPPDVAPVTDQNFIPPTYPSIDQWTGPTVLRRSSIHYYPPPPDVVPVTDTNFIYPSYPMGARTVGPTAVRTPQIHFYIQPSDFAPIQDQNFIYPNYPVGIARSVGPQALRQQARFPIVPQQFVLADYPSLCKHVALVTIAPENDRTVTLTVQDVRTVSGTTTTVATVSIFSTDIRNV